TLVAETSPVVTLNGTGLQLQFLPQSSPSVPGFRPYQPDAHSPSLLVAASDFSLFYEVVRVHPERPALQVWPGTTFGRGTAAFTLAGAPANGLMFLACSTVAAPENLFGVYEGAAMWLSLSPTAPLATASAQLDATGSATIHLTHPGGFAALLQFQAIGLGALGSGQHGSSQALAIQLLP
ncbi:MAG TPA: hypothetical protein VK348_09855, partial [Planctomycetota bacterium]|nr:hypothetical protein [Planctomycetota bacterium]